ncbi:hypothetical protein PR048_015282 [Dryococelus australis]|uniref:Uncharacterized protein n=1 Tax=Dryococelus australis TaxID=614101 RepID=A0ABQ9HGI6_9NEOP|nr:hypothetical protein PR048_015282 [Dryococelus australis]
MLGQILQIIGQNTYKRNHQVEPGLILGRATPGFLQVGIVPDDAAGQRIFSRISSFPCPCIPVLLHSHLIHSH